MSSKGNSNTAAKVVSAAQAQAGYKAAAAAFRDSEVQFKALIEALPVGVAFGDRDDVYIHVNTAFAAMLGYTADELIGGSAYDLIIAPDQIPFLMGKTKSRLLGNTEEYELQLRRKDGTTFYAAIAAAPFRNAAGEIVGTIASVIDITERQRSVASLELNQRILKSLVEGTASVTSEKFFKVAVQHLAEAVRTNYAFIGKIADGQPRMIEVLGIWEKGVLGSYPSYDVSGTPSENVIGQLELFVPRDLPRHFGRDEYILEHGLESYFGLPIFDSAGKALGLIAVMHDQPREDLIAFRSVINIFAARVGAELERLQSERARALLQKQLLQSQKMDAIGKLVAGIAHDLNNSLGAVVGHLLLMRNRSGLPSDLVQSLEVALTGCERASSLIDHLLGYSRQGKYNLCNIALEEAVRETLEFLSRIIGTNIRISVTVHGTHLNIVADQAQVQQVLTNLIINAKQAMPQGGRIEIAITSRFRQNPERFNTSAKAGMFVELSVRDSGIGISPENLDKIFEPFFTTKSQDGGSGLGLAMVYGVMQSHAGWIEVESQLGRGSCFKLFFPQSNLAVAQTELEQEPKQADLGAGSIMIIDDEPFLVELAKKFLELAGFRTYCFTRAQEALAWYSEHAHNVDLVVLDMRMPGVDGPQCFERLRQVDPQAAVIILTGYMHDQATADLISHGALKVFQKPLKYPELVKWIANNLANKKAKAQA